MLNVSIHTGNCQNLSKLKTLGGKWPMELNRKYSKEETICLNIKCVQVRLSD